MEINKLQFNQLQDFGDYCIHCGCKITNTNGSCEACDDDVSKDEWVY